MSRSPGAQGALVTPGCSHGAAAVLSPHMTTSSSLAPASHCHLVTHSSSVVLAASTIWRTDESWWTVTLIPTNSVDTLTWYMTMIMKISLMMICHLDHTTLMILNTRQHLHTHPPDLSSGTHRDMRRWMFRSDSCIHSYTGEPGSHTRPRLCSVDHPEQPRNQEDTRTWRSLECCDIWRRTHDSCPDTHWCPRRFLNKE